MTKSTISFFFFSLFCSISPFVFGNPSNHAPILFGRDKSPNPASISYSGCQLSSSLRCSSHSDSDVQMGECWSNSRVMGQKSAFFVPFQPGHQSYSSEGGPYGTCTAYACFPVENQLQSSSNLANFCFFWDGKDHTVEQDGGLEKRKEKKGKKKKNGKQITNNNDVDTTGEEESSKSTKPTSANASASASTSGSNEMPKAPGSVVIPMPMICPSNLQDCYSQSYFEQGGKLEAYASLKPTYQGVWFPPKNSQNHQPMFCDGLNLGCPTPTMQELQTQNLAKQNCDISTCKKQSGD